MILLLCFYFDLMSICDISSFCWNIGSELFFRYCQQHIFSCPSLVKPDPVLQTKNRSVVVEAWTVWLSDCGLITQEGKHTIQGMSWVWWEIYKMTVGISLTGRILAPEENTITGICFLRACHKEPKPFPDIFFNAVTNSNINVFLFGEQHCVCTRLSWHRL